jgi:tetratricopeptide (TPR) repeat protein
MRKKNSPNQTSRAGSAFASAAATVAPEATPATRPPKTDDRTRWRSAYAFIPLALALLVSVNTLWNGFASDDGQQVLSNEFIKKFSNIPYAFTSSVWAFTGGDVIFTVDPYYRPLFSVLFTINHALFGTQAWGWHLINLVIHAAVTMLVFLVIKEVTDSGWLAVITASLFAVHPAHAESVAWVSGVTDPLMALFLLPAFYFYVRYRKQKRNHLLALALGFYFLALLSKEAAITLPIFIAYCELFYFNRPLPVRARAARLLSIAALFAVPTVIYFLMRYHAISVLLVGSARYPHAFGIATVPLAVVKYLALMLVPANYSYQHYTPFVESAASFRLLAPLALLAALTAGVWVTRSRELAFAAVWFLVMLLPVLAALQQFEPAYMVQERYLYVPSIGVCLAVALGVRRLASRGWFGVPGYKAAACAALALIAVFGAVHVRQNMVWADTVSVYRRCVDVAPRSSPAHTMLSRIYYDSGRPREAEAEARAALELDPANTNAYLNLSYFSRASGKLDKAIDYIEQACDAQRPGDGLPQPRLALRAAERFRPRGSEPAQVRRNLPAPGRVVSRGPVLFRPAAV